MAKTKTTTKAKTSTSRANCRPNRRKPMSPEPTTKGSASNPAPAATAASAGSPERGAASIRYVDRADMVETFADSVTGLIFDGQTLRIEFGVTRFDDVKPNAPITGRRYPACRLVLPPVAHQSHATDRGGAHASRCCESSAAAGNAATEGRLISVRIVSG
jgi:hypothetical protein